MVGRDRRRRCRQLTWLVAHSEPRPLARLSVVSPTHDRHTHWQLILTRTASYTSQAPSTPNLLPVLPTTNTATRWQCMAFLFQSQDRWSIADYVWAAPCTLLPNLSRSQLQWQQWRRRMSWMWSDATEDGRYRRWRRRIRRVLAVSERASTVATTCSRSVESVVPPSIQTDLRWWCTMTKPPSQWLVYVSCC